MGITTRKSVTGGQPAAEHEVSILLTDADVVTPFGVDRNRIAEVSSASGRSRTSRRIWEVPGRFITGSKSPGYGGFIDHVSAPGPTSFF